MTYQQPPVMPGPDPSASWTPAPPAAAAAPAKSRLVPVLLGIIVLLLVAVGGLGFALWRSKDGGAPATTKASTVDLTQIGSSCNVAAGYRVEDAGKTLVMTVGGAFMNTDTAGCVFDKLGVPDAVRQHISTTRALDGQQTDSWPGYTARWTYHPDDGLQMTIRAA